MSEDNRTALDAAWDKAIANPGTSIDIGDLVVCDLCSVDWTTSKEVGGFIFQSKAVCPTCAIEFMASVIKHHEVRYLQALCPAGQPFADFVREYCGGKRFITAGRLPL
jgi:hypothetical protein